MASILKQYLTIINRDREYKISDVYHELVCQNNHCKYITIGLYNNMLRKSHLITRNGRIGSGYYKIQDAIDNIPIDTPQKVCVQLSKLTERAVLTRYKIKKFLEYS